MGIDVKPSRFAHRMWPLRARCRWLHPLPTNAYTDLSGITHSRPGRSNLRDQRCAAASEWASGWVRVATKEETDVLNVVSASCGSGYCRSTVRSPATGINHGGSLKACQRQKAAPGDTAQTPQKSFKPLERSTTTAGESSQANMLCQRMVQNAPYM